MKCSQSHHFLIVVLIALLPRLTHADSVQRLNHQPPDGAYVTFLLTDGTVLAQGVNVSDFWLLTPDITGSYVNGAWKQVGGLPTGYSPGSFASQVLADGRVLLEGGEFNEGEFALTNLGAVYDPLKQTWKSVSPPPHWSHIGDSPSVILPNGHFLLGDKLHRRLADLDPTTMTWTEPGSQGKNDFNAEEGWTLMPNGSVLTVDVQANPQSEMYVPAKHTWWLLCQLHAAH